MSKICDLRDCGKPAVWSFLTWVDHGDDGPLRTGHVVLCEEHEARYKDHEDVIERVRLYNAGEKETTTLTTQVAEISVVIGKLVDVVEDLSARIARLEDK